MDQPSFLEDVVAQLIRDHEGRWEELCLVLPSRRAGLFLKTFIAEHLQQAAFAPRILTIDEFVEELAEYKLPDNLTLLFELYEAYKEVEGPEKAESMDGFTKWGQLLLNDFNDVDMAMVDASKLYGDLAQIKEIEQWSFNAPELTPNQEEFRSFWQKLKHYYESFCSRLQRNGETFPGHLYRHVATDIEQLHVKIAAKHIYFIGLNALSIAEQELVRKMLASGRAKAIWDADAYYMNNRNHEAGHFQRMYRKHWKGQDFGTLYDSLSKGAREVEIIGVPKKVGQTKVAGQLLGENEQAPHFKKTAVVLADEQLLLPMMHSLPSNVGDVNVTMGYPLKFTPAQSLFEAVINLHENAQKLQPGRRTYSLYHSDVIKLLHHPYLRKTLWVPAGRNLSDDLTHIILDKNKIFIRLKDLEAELNEDQKATLSSIAFLFEPIKNLPEDLMKMLIQLIERLRTANTEGQYKSELELEYLFHYSKLLKRLQGLLIQYPVVKEIRAFKSIFNRLVNGQQLNFYGEPLRGMQLMGMLETRALDFEELIILSVNENTLPQARVDNSFIPFELKKLHGIPTHTEKDAVYAYHFYRLLQRAKKVHLIYNTENDDFGGGEQSRFITQLQHEWPRINPDVVLKHKVVSSTIKQQPEVPFEVQKDAFVLERLDALFKDGLSPTALSTYINCPLDFYYRYVLRLRESTEVEVTVEANTMGTFIHEALEALYKPFLNKPLTVDDLNSMKSRIEEEVQSQFNQKYQQEEYSQGKNYLILRVAIKFIERFLEQETARLEAPENKGKELIVKALELELGAEIEIPLQKGLRKVRIRGSADRIDSWGGFTRVIDYKTGKVTPTQLKVRDFSAVTMEEKMSKAFQVLVYALMYRKQQTNDPFPLKSGIISFKNLKEQLMNVTISGQEELTDDTLEAFEIQLANLIRDIYDPELPFRHNPDSMWCKFCGDEE